MSDAPLLSRLRVAGALAGDDRARLDVLAQRLLGGAPRSPASDRALAAWFREAGEPGAAVLDADSADALGEAVGNGLRPRALELQDLLRELAGRAPRRSGHEAEAMMMLDTGSGGVALRLVACRTDAAAGLAADASVHAFCPRDRAFRQAEARACALLATHDRSAAVRYRLLTAAGEPFTDEIRDGSIGLPLAVVALALTARQSIRALDARTALTGVISSDGAVGPVDMTGLRGKALAAQRAGARRLLVPIGQADALPGLGGVRAIEVGTVTQARRLARVVRARVRVAAVLAVLAVLAVSAAVRLDHNAHVSAQRRALAASRAVDYALRIADGAPRDALRLAGAAAALADRQTEVRRAILAARLPPGLRYLPNLPSPAEAVAWPGRAITALTAGAVLLTFPGDASWRVLARVPHHRLGALTSDGRALLAGDDGAYLLDPRAGTRSPITDQPVRAVAAGSGAAVLTLRGQVVALSRRGRRRTLRPDRPVSAISLTAAGRVVAGDRGGRVLREGGGRLRAGPSDSLDARSIGRPVSMLAVGDLDVVVGARDGSIVHRAPVSFDEDRMSSVGRPEAAMVLGFNRAAVLGSRGLVIDDAGGLLPVSREESRLSGRFTALALSRDGDHLVAAGREVAIEDARDALAANVFSTNAVSFKPDGRLIGISGGAAGMFVQGRGKDPQIQGRAPIGQGAIRTSPDGRWATQVLAVNRIKLWDTRAGTVRMITLTDSSGTSLPSLYYSMAPLDDGRIVFSSPSSAQTFVVRPGERRAQPTYSLASVFAQAAGPDTVLLANDDRVALVRVTQAETVARARLTGERVIRMGASEDGRRLFLASAGGSVWSWSWQHDAMPRLLARVGGPVVALAVRPDGRLLALSAFTGTRTTTQYLVDVQARRTFTLERPQPLVSGALAFDRSGTRLALAAVSPIGVESTTTSLSGSQACMAAGGGRVPAALWRAAIEGLAVAAPACAGHAP